MYSLADIRLTCVSADELSSCPLFFFFNDTATTEIYTLSLHDALPISGRPPPSHPVPEVLRRVGEPHSGGETRRAALPLDAHPRDRHTRQGGERLRVEGRATG